MKIIKPVPRLKVQRDGSSMIIPKEDLNCIIHSISKYTWGFMPQKNKVLVGLYTNWSIPWARRGEFTSNWGEITTR